MGSDLRYNLINSFRTIDQWRANVLFNMSGSTVAGFKKRDIRLGINSGDRLLFSGQASNTDQGVRLGAQAGNSELVINGYTLSIKQDNPNFNAGNPSTYMSLIGNGYFAVAESLAPGARIFYTRDGSFNWKNVGEINGSPRYQLVNKQGLFVLRDQDIETDPTTKQVRVKKIDPRLANGQPNLDYPGGMFMSRGAPGARDGAFKDASQTVPGHVYGLLGHQQFGGDLSQTNQAALTAFYGVPGDHSSNIAIVKIPNASSLAPSSYGGQIYEAPVSARSGLVHDSLTGWFKREGINGPHILPNSLEEPDSRAMLQITEQESLAANYVFQNLSTFMQDYNKGIDELLAIIR